MKFMIFCKKKFELQKRLPHVDQSEAVTSLSLAASSVPLRRSSLNVKINLRELFNSQI